MKAILRSGGTFALFLFVWTALFAQTPAVRDTGAHPSLPDHPRYAFEHFGEQFGLGAVTVTTMAQDHQGFLWFGTLTGVYRYDGSSVQHFGEEEGLPSNHTYEILAAPDGRLWARTRKGIARFESRRFVPVSIPAESGGLADVNQSFAVDESGTLFAAAEHGLLRIDGRDGTVRVFGSADGLPAAPIEAIVRGPNDSIWFAAGRRIGRLAPGSFKPEILASPELPADAVRTLLVDGTGKLWVRGLNQISYVDLKKPAPQPLVAVGQDIPGANLYGGPSLDQHGNVMLPTVVGLYRRTGDRWQLMDRANGLTSSAAFSALEDREGTIWIGLAGAGLDRWPGSRQWSGWADSDGLTDSLVLSVLRDKRNRLWVGTNTGLATWGTEQHRWKTWAGTRESPHFGVGRMLLTPDGNVWALSASGIRRFDAAGANPFPLEVSMPKSSSPVTGIAAAADGSVWAGGQNKLFAIRSQDGRLALQEVSVPAANHDSLATLSSSPNGVLWTGGRGGVSRFDGVHWRHFDRGDGLLTNRVRNVYATGDDEVWIGYPDEGSVTRMRLGPDGRAAVSHLRKGVCVLGVDRNRNVWLEMEQSVGMMAPDGSVRTFTQSDGLIWNDVNCEAFWEDTDGTILIGTSHGLARFDPSQEALRHTPPAVVLTGAEFGEKDRLKDANPAVEIQDRAFHAQFAALTFRDSDRVRCRYRLRGLESEFTETSLREALYSALPPGDYTFEVACGSPDLGWTSSPATYSFTVLAPWWRSSWAVLAGLLTFALLVAGFTRLRTRRLESERKRLEAAVAERSAELARANRELEEASLTDPLTGARNRRFFYSTIAADANQASRAYYSEIEGYSRDHRDLVFYLIDLDHFKDVNDAHGHDAGDEVLVHVAQRLARIVRQSDFLIRWGGEEFLVVCRAADRKDAAIFAERILAAVGREPFSISGGEKVSKTCSVGWAPFPWDPGVAMLSVDEVLKLADRGLYRAKELGRNQAVGMLPLEMAEVPVGVASGDGERAASCASTHEVVCSGPARS